MRTILLLLAKWTLNAHLVGVRLEDHTGGGKMLEDPEFSYMMLSMVERNVKKFQRLAHDGARLSSCLLTGKAGVERVFICLLANMIDCSLYTLFTFGTVVDCCSRCVVMLLLCVCYVLFVGVCCVCVNWLEQLFRLVPLLVCLSCLLVLYLLLFVSSYACPSVSRSVGWSVGLFLCLGGVFFCFSLSLLGSLFAARLFRVLLF